jgi:aryl-alcohol dehydrogenase-like predicted oxidoreductase
MQLERLHDDRAAATALLRRALELGIDHYDTAAFYGDGVVNAMLRDALPLDEVTVVTKIGATPNPGGAVRLRTAQKPHELRASVEQNLTELGMERLPVVYLRRTDRGPGIVAEGDQIVPIAEQLTELVALREEGKIGAIGLSGVSLDSLREALPFGIVAVQNSYSLVQREGDDLLELCREQGIAWVPFFPLGGAFPAHPKVIDLPSVRAAATSTGATPSQVGLAWLLGHAPHILLIPGTTSIEHLEQNVAAADVRVPAGLA